MAAVVLENKAEKEMGMVAKGTKQVVVAGVLAALLVGAVGVFAFSLGKYETVKESNGAITERDIAVTN